MDYETFFKAYDQSAWYAEQQEKDAARYASKYTDEEWAAWNKQKELEDRIDAATASPASAAGGA